MNQMHSIGTTGSVNNKASQYVYTLQLNAKHSIKAVSKACNYFIQPDFMV